MSEPTQISVPSHVPADRVVDFDIANDPAFKYDVFKRLAEMRDGSPALVYTTQNGGHWMAFGHDVIERVMSDAETFSSTHIGGAAMGGLGMIPLGLDPPEHTPWRHLLLKHLGPAQVRSLEPFVRSWAERLIGRLEGTTSCDFLKAVAEPMPVSVFMETMGLPLSRFEEFRGLVMKALTPPEDGSMANTEATAQIGSLLEQLIEERRKEPRDDLVSKLLADQVNGRPITQAEMMSICYLLFLAGLDTVTNAMTYGMRHLAKNPALQEELRRDRSLIPAMVEKMLRLYTFVNTHRFAKHDTVLDGVPIKQGEMVWCILWAGSNEPGEEIEGARHMAFGGGHHMCLGMHLARLELRVMYEVWFERIGRFTLAPDDKPAMRGGSVMNITRLLLNLEPLQKKAA